MLNHMLADMSGTLHQRMRDGPYDSKYEQDLIVTDASRASRQQQDLTLVDVSETSSQRRRDGPYASRRR